MDYITWTVYFFKMANIKEGDIFMRWKLFCTALLTGFVFICGYAQNQRNQRSTAYYEEMVGNLSNQVRLLQDENASLSSKVHTMRQEIQQLRQQLKSIQDEMAQLRKMIMEESTTRQKQMEMIANRIQQAADAQARANAEARKRAQREAAEARKQSVQNDAQEEYDYYVVEAGVTLSAISRATGVSVARLKQVNGMKSDVLRVGQKIKIPRK